MRELICPVCGKTFIYFTNSLFKLVVDGKTQRYCGNKCYSSVKKELEKNRKYNRRRRGGY